MPRKSSRTSGSSPEKAATPRRATRRGQKVEEPVVETVVDQIPPHLLRASDESSEQSDNDSDYGSPKKGKGRVTSGGSGRGRGRKPKEVVVVEEKTTPSRPRRGRRAARDKTPETITEESEQISQEESIHSQTTGDERDETSTQSEHTAEKTPEPVIEAIPEEVEQPVVEGAITEELKQQPEVAEPIQSSPSSAKDQEKIEEIENPEKVSVEVQDLQSKNNDQAPVNEEEENDDDDDEDDENEVKIHDDVVIDETIREDEIEDLKKEETNINNEEEESKEAVVIIEESSTEVEAEDEVSKETPELPQQEEDSIPSEKVESKQEEQQKVRARSSSGEIYEDPSEKMDVDSSMEIQNKKKESPVKPTIVETKKNSPVKTSLKEEIKVDEPKGTSGHQRKRKWGARKVDSEIAITTDSLKNVISEEIKPVPLSDVKLLTPEREPEEKRPRTKSTAEEKDAKKKLLMERLRKQEEEEERRNELLAKVMERRQASPNIVVTNGAGKDRKVALVHEDLSAAAQAPPTPPKNQTSRVLFITNLVRPLTVASLKILLARTGKVEDLWLDQIKSKCFVRFEKEDEAVETRHALHGVKWPDHNLKTLNVEFSTEEEMNKVALPALADRDAVASEVGREGKSGFGWSKADVQKSPEDRSKVSRRTREWDVGKREDADWDRERDESRRRRRSSERENRREKDRKVDDSTEKKRSPSLAVEEKVDAVETITPPGRLLDDLFRKTVAVPCIYWLPLTEEQVREKEEQRQKNLAEHKRRLDEMVKQQKERREAREQRIRERQHDRKRSRSNSKGASRNRRRSRSNSRGGGGGGRNPNPNRFDRR